MTAPNPSLAPASAGFVEWVRDAATALGSRPADPDTVARWGDEELVGAISTLADLRRLVDARTAALSGELHRRSQPEASGDPGDPGLARRSGHRTVEQLLRATTGLGGLEASRLVRAGRAIADATDARGATGASAHDLDAPPLGPDGPTASPSSEPWMHVAARALTLGLMGVGSVDAIRRGVGVPREGIGPDVLGVLVRQLCAEAVGAEVCRSDVGRGVGLEHPVDSDSEEARSAHDGTTEPLHEDRILVRARLLRDLADLDAVEEREQARRDERALTLHRRADGMTRLSWLLDPESAAHVTDLYDRATSPRLGGPRTGVQFVGERDGVQGGETGGETGGEGSGGGSTDATAASSQGIAERLRRDERSTAQLASDAFLHLLTAGAAADSSQLLAGPTAAVRVLISADTLATRRGAATVEGQHDVVSLPTVDRLLCGGVVTPIVVDTAGQPLDVGRDQRTFTHRQRVALAARDGGCRWPGCERPPSWCEAHHIDEWARDQGRTDTHRGILLCKHHHLLAHNHGWEITVAAPAVGALIDSSLRRSREGGRGRDPGSGPGRDHGRERVRGQGDPAADEYWLTPPRAVDPERKPVRMPHRSLVHRLHVERST